MTRDAIEFDLPAAEAPSVRLPGTDTFVQVGTRLPRAVAHAGAHLGLLLGGTSPAGPRHELSRTLFSFLAVLALARHEGREEVTLAEVASRAMLGSRGGDPWRSARSLGTELLRIVAPQVPGDPNEAWPSRSTALVQIKQRRSTIASVSSGPFRLNPRYSLEGDLFRLRALFASRGHLSDGCPPDEPPASYRAATEQALVLTAAGCEAEAIAVMVAALDRAGPLSDHERAGALRMVGGLEMQLGWSHHARRHARALAMLAERLGDRVILADAWHLHALIARQLDAFGDSVRFGQKALAVLGASQLRRDSSPRVIELQRSLGVAYSQAVCRKERVGHFVARGSCKDRKWGHATRLLRLAVEGSMDRGEPSEIAHSLMRLANHRLAQHHRSPEEEREICDAAERAAAMSVQAQAIWDRELACEHLLRAGAGRATAALKTLAACRDQNDARGYTHQIRLIDDTLQRAGVAPDSLPSPHG